MGCYKIKTGIAVIDDGDSRFIVDERGQKRITSTLISELVGLIRKGIGDEDGLVAAVEDRFPLEEIYYALIQLEKQGVIAGDEAQSESPGELFRAKAYGRDGTGCPSPGISPLTVRVFAVGEAHLSAHDLALSLARSDVLEVESVPDWHEVEASLNGVYVAVTPDYLEPELEDFGCFAHDHRLRWLPFKPRGVIPWVGPLFVPEETGCVACLLDRVRGHRRLEADHIRVNGGNRSLRLSVGQTVHSLEIVAGLLAVELEKLAGGGTSELAGRVSAFDFGTPTLTWHPLTKRPQCPLCGDLRTGVIPEGPLTLSSRRKADYRDCGQRVCSAMETIERYSHLVSPITGVIGRIMPLEEIPSCFGRVMRSDWIVREGDEARPQERSELRRDKRNPRAVALGFSSGKGRSEPQARASALGEAVERYCSQYEGHEPHIRAPLVELGEAAIHPHDLMGFSQRQYRDRETWRRKGETAYVPDPYDPVRPIDWTPAWSLTEKRWRFVPSAFVYYSYPREGGGDICLGCSNGVAAGNCLEEAVIQGFFELAERDAVAMWWYHKLLKPAVDWRTFGSPYAAAVDAAMDKMGMRLHVLDLTNDLGVPVFAANLFMDNEDARFKSIGLGCHRDPCIALERAVSELGQSWRRAEMDQHSLRFQNSSHSHEPFLRPDPHQACKTLSDFSIEGHDDFLDDIDDVVRMLHRRKLEILTVDLTRPDVGFPVVRVIVPGMVHFWPRFGRLRLFEVPKAAGWISMDTDEDDLNPVPFYL